MTTEPMPSESPTTAALTGADGPPPTLLARWLPILCSLVCIGLMAAVIVLATNTEEATDPATTPRSGAVPPHGMGANEPFGAPPGYRPPASLLQACGPLDPSKPPRIALKGDMTELDFGDLKQGITLVREHAFENAGTGPLCIASVKSTCGCLKASLVGSKRRFEPGEGGVLRLAVDTTGKMGVINKRVTITCNDPKTPLKSFRVKMDINAGLMSDPRYLQFGNVPPSTTTSRSVYLRTKKEDTAWKVTGVKSVRAVRGQEPVKYGFEVEAVNDDRVRRLKVRITHPGLAKTGSYHDRIAIETTHPERPQVIVNAHIHVVPRIVFRARMISLGFVRAGIPRAPTRARIQPGAAGIVFDITGVEIVAAEGKPFGPAGAPFLATFGKDSRGWWVDVKFDGKSREPGLIEAVLVVKTNDAEQPELRVPVRATLQAPR
jgi:hypothetical protein